MGSVSVSSDASASADAAASCRGGIKTNGGSDRGNILPQAEWFGLMSREVWLFKASAYIQCHTGHSDRTCRSWTGMQSEPPARVLALLLRSNDGPRVLAWIMRDSNTSWWLALCEARRALAIVE